MTPTTVLQQRERNIEFESKTVCMGYSKQMYADLEFIKHGAGCAYEHCIEHMPLEYGESSCPVFGHDCPGGSGQANHCINQEKEYDAMNKAQYN
jgi:hypothetical protein